MTTIRTLLTSSYRFSASVRLLSRPVPVDLPDLARLAFFLPIDGNAVRHITLSLSLCAHTWLPRPAGPIPVTVELAKSHKVRDSGKSRTVYFGRCEILMHINNVRSSRTGKTANPTRHPRRGKIHGVIAGLLSFVLPRHSARVFTGRQRTSRRPCGRLTDKKKTCYNENQKHNVSTKKKRHDLNEPHPGYVQPRRRHTERIRKKKSLTTTIVQNRLYCFYGAIIWSVK